MYGSVVGSALLPARLSAFCLAPPLSTSVTRTVREPELFSGELSRTFGSGSVQNVGRTPAHHILKLEGVWESFESSRYHGLRPGSNLCPFQFVIIVVTDKIQIHISNSTQVKMDISF